MRFGLSLSPDEISARDEPAAAEVADDIESLSEEEEGVVEPGGPSLGFGGWGGREPAGDSQDFGSSVVIVVIVAI